MHQQPPIKLHVSDKWCVKWLGQMNILCNARVGTACLMTKLPHGSKGKVTAIVLMSNRLQDKVHDPGNNQGSGTMRKGLNQKADKAATEQHCSDPGELQCDH